MAEGFKRRGKINKMYLFHFPSFEGYPNSVSPEQVIIN